jgi:16S rRNA (guanine527-N7)-methyltransferase
MAFVASDRAKDLDAPLSAALAALHLDAEAEQRTALLGYLLLLQRWNAVHNLSATNDAKDLLQRHVVDCLSIVPSLLRHAAGRPMKVLDAGTGAGLPAVVLAIMLRRSSITAVDAVGKKAAFLRQVAGELGLANLRPLHARVESMPANEEGFDVVTSRAFSSLRAFVRATMRLIDSRGVWAAMKGKPPEAEILDLPSECQLFHVERLLVPGLDAERCLVWMKPAAAG